MVSEDQQRIIIAMTVSVPLSFLLRFVRGFTYREVYSVLVGTLLQYYVYGFDLIYVFGLHCIVYAICSFAPHKCGGIVTIASLVVLSIFHIYRMIIDYGSWTIDISGVLMTVICKYSLFAYSVQDGTRKNE